MVNWTAGAVFAVVWACATLPVMLVGTFLFWRQRAVQPIRPRSPVLVVVTDCILLLYTLLLCCQRIIDQDYPCLLNIWSGYVGTIVLFNSYLWRCWTLFYNFNLAATRLFQFEHADAADEEPAEPQPTSLCGRVASGCRTVGQLLCSTKNESGGKGNFFLTHRHLTHQDFLLKVNVFIFLGLMVAPTVLSSTRPAIADHAGDECEHVSGPQQTILAGYVAVYVALFLWFAFSLRSAADGFHIKAELKVTGVIAGLAVVPWYVFNNFAKTTNREVFPFSTLCILVAIQAAFACSTLAPLYASVYMQEENGLSTPGGGAKGRSTIYRGQSALLVLASSGSFHPASRGCSVVEKDGPASPSVRSSVGSPSASSRLSATSPRGSALGIISENGGASDGDPSATRHDRLFKILAEPEGALVFRQFLTKEFSVENILFYDEVERLRSELAQAQRDNAPPEQIALRMVLEARKLHAKYIPPGAPYQVNLPDPVVRRCEAHLRWEARAAGAPPALPGQLDAPTRNARVHSAAVHGNPQMIPLRQMNSSSAPPGPFSAVASAANRAAMSNHDAASADLSQVRLSLNPATPEAAAAEQATGSSSSPSLSASSPPPNLVPGFDNATPGLGPAPPPALSPPMSHVAEPSQRTLFDDAQRTIYVLMEKDSMLRFVRSELYLQWQQRQIDEERMRAEEERRKQVLQEMDLV